MHAQPWFGLLRGLLFALWPGMHFPAVSAPRRLGKRPALRRRRMLLALVAALTTFAMLLQWHAAPAELSAALVAAGAARHAVVRLAGCRLRHRADGRVGAAAR